MLTVNFFQQVMPNSNSRAHSLGGKQASWECSPKETGLYSLSPWRVAVSAHILSDQSLLFVASPSESHFKQVLTLILSGDSAEGQLPVDSKPKEGRTKGKGRRN